MIENSLLSQSETLALVASYQATGDEEAFAILLAHNERLLMSIANRYMVTGAAGDAQMEDLMQWGRIGFLRALQDYNPATGNKFSSYAYWWIRQYISRDGKKQGQSISMSYGATQKRYHLSRASSEYFQEFHRDPTAAELAQLTGYRHVDSLRSGTVSLDGSDSRRENEAYLDILADESVDVQADAERAADCTYNRKVLDYVGALPANMRDVLYMVYGLGGHEIMSMADIARLLGVSRERIRQIEQSGLKKLREITNIGDIFA